MKKTRLVSAVLAASLMLSACGGSEAGTSDISKTNKNVVFREDANAFNLEEGDVSQIVVAGDILYVEQYIYDYNQPQARSEAAADAAAETTTVVAETLSAEEVAVSETVVEESVAEDMIE